MLVFSRDTVYKDPIRDVLLVRETDDADEIEVFALDILQIDDSSFLFMEYWSLAFGRLGTYFAS